MTLYPEMHSNLSVGGFEEQKKSESGIGMTSSSISYGKKRNLYPRKPHDAEEPQEIVRVLETAKSNCDQKAVAKHPKPCEIR